MNDAHLVGRAAAGDRTAFEQLYQRHWQAVYRYAWVLTGSVSDAEDVTQESFLALVRAPKAFDPSRAQLRTWLIAIARNCHRQLLRRRSRDMGSRELDTAIPANLDETLVQKEQADALHAAIDALPIRQKEALFLFEFEQLSLAEIAEVLATDPNTVKARLYRARESLKRVLVRSKEHAI